MQNKAHKKSKYKEPMIDFALQEVWRWKSKVGDEYRKLGWQKFKAKLTKESSRFSNKYNIVFE